MKAEIIAVGTELLLGQIVNSNARFLSEELASQGINVYYHTTVGDNKGRLQEALAIAGRRVNLVITTGGLGPTGDDLTKETLAEFLNLPLELNNPELVKLKDFFLQRKLNWVENNTRQAMFPQGSYILKNERGTAPGLAIKVNGCSYILLPGPPREMETMFMNYAVPWLKENYIPSDTLPLYSHVLKFLGITESRLEEVLEDLFAAQRDITLAPLAKTGEIQVRLTTRARTREEFLEKINPLLGEIKKRTGKYLVSSDGISVAEAIGRQLAARGLRVSTAESCTGGLLAAELTSVPGSSQYFSGSLVAYSNEVKTEVLGVPVRLIEEFGAVSPEVAGAMAQRVREISGTDLGIGITGIAGPDGGTLEKPVGLVYIALAAEGKIRSEGYNFRGPRDIIRRRSVNTALNLIWQYLSENNNGA